MNYNNNNNNEDFFLIILYCHLIKYMYINKYKKKLYKIKLKNKN